MGREEITNRQPMAIKNLAELKRIIKLSWVNQIIRTIQPTGGARDKSSQTPLRPVSCSLRHPTASEVIIPLNIYSPTRGAEWVAANQMTMQFNRTRHQEGICQG